MQRRNEQGTALIMAMWFTILVAGVVSSGTTLYIANKKKADVRFQQSAQAIQFARSGITETLTWFRRQTSQPVTVFEPVINLSSIPPIQDTDDADIGIMREFKIAGKTWGRYEVWKEWAADPDPVRLAWRNQLYSSDVSLQRNQGIHGAAWRIRSVGYVFIKKDANTAFNQRPNQMLGTMMLESEILRLKIAPPGEAAVSSVDGNSVIINSNGRIRGFSKAGIFYDSGSGNPSTGPSSQNRVTGTPSLSPSGSYAGGVEDVFGVTLAELKGMADHYITDPNNFPSPIPANSIIVCECSSITFDSSRPLTGTALVYIDAKVTISNESSSVFNGLLYVKGSMNMNAPSELNGALVMDGKVKVQGVGDFATINYDESVLETLRLEIGNYRLSGAVRPILNRENL